MSFNQYGKRPRVDEVRSDPDRHMRSHEFHQVNVHGGQGHVVGNLYYARLSPYEKLLESLKFGEMNERFNSIVEPHETNFDWAFNECISEGKLEYYWPGGEIVTSHFDLDDPCGFMKWLKSDGKVFWISGKPGSGKSTLMKFLTRHEKTVNTLQSTCQTPCIVLQHFFWMPGSSLQYSMKGLLCHLLYQICDSQGQVAETLLIGPDGTEPDSSICKLRLSSKSNIADWSESDLQTCIEFCLRKLTTTVCIFLDGIDEYDQNQNTRTIIKFIQQLAGIEDVKFCVSSRPDLVLKNSLAEYPHFKIQDYNYSDIKEIVTDRLRQEAEEMASHLMDEQELNGLADDITRRAEGVFIWALLAVNNTLDGINLRMKKSELLANLNRLPTDMNNLYELALRRAEKRLQAPDPWLKWLFSVPIRLWDCFSVMEIAASIPVSEGERESIVPFGPSEWLQQSENVRRRVMMRFAGLLEASEFCAAKTLGPPNRMVVRQIGMALARIQSLGASRSKRFCARHFCGTEFMKSLEGGSSDRAETPSDDDNLQLNSIDSCFKAVHRTAYDFFDQRNLSLEQDEKLGLSRMIARCLLMHHCRRLLTSNLPEFDSPSLIAPYCGRFLDRHVLLQSIVCEVVQYPILAQVSCKQKLDSELILYYDLYGGLVLRGFSIISHLDTYPEVKSSAYYKGYLVLCQLANFKMQRDSRLGYQSTLQELTYAVESGADLLSPQIFGIWSSAEGWDLTQVRPVAIAYLTVLQLLFDGELNAAADLFGVIQKAILNLELNSAEEPTQMTIAKFIAPADHHEVSYRLILPYQDAIAFISKILGDPRGGCRQSMMGFASYGLTALSEADLSTGQSHIFGSFAIAEPLICKALQQVGPCSTSFIFNATLYSRDRSDCVGKRALFTCSDGAIIEDFICAPAISEEMQGKDWYFKGALRKWHQAREAGETTASETARKWESKHDLVPEYEKRPGGYAFVKN